VALVFEKQLDPTSIN